MGLKSARRENYYRLDSARERERERETTRRLGVMEVVGRERLKIMTGTCDTEGRIFVIIGQDAAGENERNGAKEADERQRLDGVAQLVRATSRVPSSSPSLSSPGRYPALGDLWRNATNCLFFHGFLSRQFSR